MLQSFVRGCKQAQVAAGAKLQRPWSLFIPQRQPFSLFASSYYRRHLLKGQTVQKLGERFPLNRLCHMIQKKKISWQVNLMIICTEWSKSFPLNLNKAVHVWKKKQAKTIKLSILWSDFRTRMWCATMCTFRPMDGMCTWLHITCCRQMGWSSNLLLGHSMNSNCSAVRSIDCEHHGRRSYKSVQHWLSEKITPKKFSPGAEAGRRYSTTRLARRSAFLGAAPDPSKSF